jgi:hypothetical protein
MNKLLPLNTLCRHDLRQVLDLLSTPTIHELILGQ